MVAFVIIYVMIVFSFVAPLGVALFYEGKLKDQRLQFEGTVEEIKKRKPTPLEALYASDPDMLRIHYAISEMPEFQWVEHPRPTSVHEEDDGLIVVLKSDTELSAFDDAVKKPKEEISEAKLPPTSPPPTTVND